MSLSKATRHKSSVVLIAVLAAIVISTAIVIVAANVAPVVPVMAAIMVVIAITALAVILRSQDRRQRQDANTSDHGIVVAIVVALGRITAIIIRGRGDGGAATQHGQYQRGTEETFHGIVLSW